jgi:hypothetical protein
LCIAQAVWGHEIVLSDIAFMQNLQGVVAFIAQHFLDESGRMIVSYVAARYGLALPVLQLIVTTLERASPLNAESTILRSRPVAIRPYVMILTPTRIEAGNAPF